jgi:hypothetical protein
VKEYEVYVPLRYNDGSPVEPDVIARIGEELLDEFGGVTFFPQRNRGFWKMGHVTFRDDIVIFRALAAKVRPARRFMRQFKEELKKELKQEEMLIVERDVRTL